MNSRPLRIGHGQDTLGSFIKRRPWFWLEKKLVDCIFVNPSSARKVYQSLAENLTAKEPPIWAGLLANAVRTRGKSVKILDCEALDLTAEEAAWAISREGFALIAIMAYGQQPSASTQVMPAIAELIQKLKKFTDKILVIGGHPSALPMQTCAELKVDVCKGEGLETIIGLLANKKKRDIPGLCYSDECGDIQANLPAANIPQEKLHQVMPGVAWDLLPMEKYRAHNWHAFSNNNDRGNYASIYTSLGCPFSCSFCCINAPFEGSSFRYWKPSFTLDQIDTLASTYGIKNLKIADEMFVLKKDHYMAIAEGLIERRHALNIWAYARIDTVNPDTLATLKRAGFNWLALGIESGSRFVRDGVKKGRFGQDDIRSIVKQIKDAGINVIGNYIFGLPDDDYKSMNETLEMAIDLNCEMANFYSAMAYPGSRLYTMAKARGWELPKSWIGYSQHSRECLPLRTEHLTSGEVLEFRDYAFDQYFKNDQYLNMVLEKFGPETRDGITQMTKHKLVRDNAARNMTK